MKIEGGPILFLFLPSCEISPIMKAIVSFEVFFTRFEFVIRHSWKINIVIFICEGFIKICLTYYIYKKRIFTSVYRNFIVLFSAFR